VESSYQNLFIFGVTPAAAIGSVWYVFHTLRFSQPLKDAVLETLTNPKRPASELLRLQFLLLRRASIGSRPFSLRRLFIALGLLAFWVGFLAISCWLTPQFFYGFVGSNYFEFMQVSPFVSAALILATAILFLASITIFDLLLSLVLFRRVSSLANVGLLIIAYIVALFFAYVFARICGAIYTLATTGVNPLHPAALFILAKYSFQVALEPFTAPRVALYLFSESMTLPFTRFAFPEMAQFGALYGVNFAREVLSSIALLSMLLTSIAFISLLNVSYFLGLFIVRVELFVRKIYGYDQAELLKSPVEYLGRVACVVAAIIVILLSALAYFAMPSAENTEESSLSQRRLQYLNPSDAL
jgi:hypothetical protein